MRYSLNDAVPRAHESVWIAPNATVIGQVELAEDSSVWFGAVLRGDNDSIAVGVGSNVQDGSVLHTDRGLQVRIGRGVTIGHLVMLHGCTIGDDTLVGIKSVILNRAVVGRHCLIGANTLITEDKVIPDGSLVMGAPGKVIRPLTPEEIAAVELSARSYVLLARRYRDGLKAAD